MVEPRSADVETLDVLFIEDDAALTEMYRLKLELDGYWVQVASPETAVAQARARRPDIVFIDLSSGLPQRLRVLDQVRKAVHRPSLPAIVLSSLRAEQLQERGAKLTACDYLITGQVPYSAALTGLDTREWTGRRTPPNQQAAAPSGINIWPLRVDGWSKAGHEALEPRSRRPRSCPRAVSTRATRVLVLWLHYWRTIESPCPRGIPEVVSSHQRASIRS